MKRNISYKCKKAFTIIEMLVATTIFGMLITLGYESLSTSIISTKKTEMMREVQFEVRDIIQFISKDIKNPDLENILILSDNNIMTLHFSPPEAPSYEHTYELDDSNKTIIYKVNGIKVADLNTSFITIEKIDPSLPIFEPNNANADFVTISNLKATTTKGTKSYTIPFSTTIAK